LVEKNPDGMPRKPGTGDRVCSDHFISGKKSNDPLSPDYVPSKKCENPDYEDKSDESEDEKMDESYKRVKHRHAVQAMHEEECRLEEDIRKQAIRGTSHDHPYCRETIQHVSPE